MILPWTILQVLAAATSLDAQDGVVGTKWVSNALSEAMEGFAPSSQTNMRCKHESQLYLESLANFTLWAVQMLDSSSVSVGGLLIGDRFSLGHYDECLAVQSPVKAQHCLATLQFGPSPHLYPPFYRPPDTLFKELPLSVSAWDKVKVTLDSSVTRRDVFHWALCLPASCTPLDLQQSLNTTVQSVFTKYSLSASVNVDPEYCHTSDSGDIPTTIGYFTTRLAMYLALILSLLATLYDYITSYYKQDKLESPVARKFQKLFMAFSLRKNMNELVETGKDKRLDIANGAKVISVTAILFGHRIMYSYGLSLGNQGDWEPRMERNFWENAIMNATHLVDIFFLITGTITFLVLYSTLQKKKGYNAPLFLILRWLRIVPPYLLMIGIVGWLLPHMSEGPLWSKRVGLESRRCQENWWLNLLFVNNYIHADNECLLLSWYLACDMQLFLVGLVAVYTLWRWPRAGYALLAALLAAAIAIPFLVTMANGYYGTIRFYPNTLLNDPYSNDQFSSMYVKSHNRAAPYIIGIIAAYIATKLKEANYRFSTRTILIGFLVLFGGGYAHQTYAFLFYQRERPYSALENALYASLHRVTFPMGVAWIVITHFIQRFRLFKVLLAAQVFTPLSRLVYGLVLIHPTLQMAEAAAVRHSEHMQYPKMFWMACADFIVSTLLALSLYLMVEAPSKNITKALFLDKARTTDHKSNTNNNNTEGNTDNPKNVIISRM